MRDAVTESRLLITAESAGDGESTLLITPRARDPERTMAIVDDPAHSWIRDTWHGMSTDPPAR